MRYRLVLFTLALVACSGETGTITPDATVPDTTVPDYSTVDLVLADQAPEAAATDFSSATDLPVPDFATPDLPIDTGAACEAGEGCFLDPCQANDDCLSGWCVGHMGETVCTMLCESECPQGWACQQLPAAVPDVVWICVSPHANLCLPCASAQGCQGAAVDDVCVDYAKQGAFCGSSCLLDDDCPWGFSCKSTLTTDGVEVTQCVADAGVCPCSKRAVKLGLFTTCQMANEFGACPGKRACGEEGLSDCDAPSPEPEICDGKDNDCDSDIDEPEFVDGDNVNLCDDEKLCTQDLCKGADGCHNIPLEQGECMDGNPCTVADHCVAGVCTGDPVQCDDENPCTDDVCTATGGCEYPPTAAECSDNDPCTLGDHCVDGNCLGEAVNCQCQTDGDCDVLEDDNVCNGTLFCDTSGVPFVCSLTPDSQIDCPPPSGANAPCLQATCDPISGQCGLEPANDGHPCEDGNMCTLADTCNAGFCSPGPTANCNDGNPCTSDSCTPETGCVHNHNQDPCSDDDACTVADTCADGQCLPGQPLSCNDNDPCTDDSCNPQTGCTFTPNLGPCSDGNACTNNDTCANGQCLPGTPVVCKDDNPCTTDSCDPAIGCVTKLNDLPCNDSDICTINDHCHLGECIGAGNLPCSDNNPCTDDACQPEVGCTFTANNGPCNDGTMCTTGDHCAEGMCKPTGFLTCNDNNPCTDDTCDPDTGCVTSDNQNPCNDGDKCTVTDVCTNGQCTGSGALNCNDGNVCTDDSCNPDTGCVSSNNQADCNDDNLCTPFDKCLDGECIGSGAVDCNDNNICTDEECLPAQGCVKTNNTTSCEDGDQCTLNDQCSGSQCQPGNALECNDNNECTSDSCDPDSGCVFVEDQDCCGNGVINEGEQCDDGNDNNNDYCNNNCQFSGSVFSQYNSAGRTVYIFKSDSNVPLSTYDNFCQSLGLQWWVPKSSPDAQTLLEHCHNLNGGHHTWIIQKNNTSPGAIAGFAVSVHGPSCVSFSDSGFSAVRWQWACAFCDPENYGVTKCWDADHTYDWLACQGG